jgi:alpha-L-fucosidase
LLINFPVDTRGLIHEKDEEQILKLAKALKADFANNLAQGKEVTASNTRGNSKKYKAENVNDGNPDTYWATGDEVVAASLSIDFGEEISLNRLLLQEDIRLGQRIKAFSVEAFNNGTWKEIDKQTTIGSKRILRLPDTKATQLRINILDAKACPVISNIEVYNAPKVLVEPEIIRNKEGVVSIKSFDSGLKTYFTLDGSEPSTRSAEYIKPFLSPDKATVKAIVVDDNGKQSPVATAGFDIPKIKWKMSGKLAGEPQAEAIFDGDSQTAWNVESKPPVDWVIDLGEEYTINGFVYLPDQGRRNPGIIFNYEFYVSKDGK